MSYQRIHEGWKRYLNEAEGNSMQICSPAWWATGGGDETLNNWIRELNDLGIESNGFEDARQGNKLIIVHGDHPNLKQFKAFLQRASGVNLDEVLQPLSDERCEDGRKVQMAASNV